ncbi:TonB-dependent receptor [Maribacter halichondriae]|uniref:TonB-dependent receptor n=1 Tax=Maribacter halichondriae TaxID=2980554 RepID=UPI00235A100A|nr:carboxypeptidase-like regulatory domain-containing protein [Maribacter sp. Hal144]
MKCFKIIFLIINLCAFNIISAQTATITGVVLNEENAPLRNVNITSGAKGASTDTNGFYVLEIVPDQETTITFSHLGHKDVILENLLLTTNETYEFNPVMKTDAIQIDGVTVTPTGEKSVEGILVVPPNIIRKIPGANAGVENILKLLPGVASNNELSTQYSVRGGNYDENLVYVNEIEVYRPFLVRSAQQEGLSFANSDLVQNVKFSVGGFQAKYGDKLSSVLDITYKNPTNFGVQMDLSFLGASTSVETVSKSKNFSSISGLRYRNNALLVNSQQTQSNFNPTFLDLQSYLTFRFSKKFHLNFLGTLSVNDYRNEPIDRKTNFGTLIEPRALIVNYEGNEKNRFDTALGALKGTYFVNDDLSLKIISSLYHTVEEERSDVISRYELGDVDTNLGSETLGEVTNSRGLGSQFKRARNNFDALIFNLSHRGIYTKNENALEWGLKYTHEDIRDELRESEFIDSAGYSIRPPLPEFINNQPEDPFNAPIVPFTGVSSRNSIKTNRFSGFVQYSERVDLSSLIFYYNVGLRSQLWTTSGTEVAKVSQAVFSPRAQLAIKPDWKSDMLFRLSGGVYHQPPFYRELRDSTGTIQPDVLAQKSVHLVLGNEFSFLLWERPFTLISEAYYKKLDNVNPYTLEDVRIRYAANNNAKAYTYGTELRLNGAFVPGTESWVSIGYLKTEEDINDRGYISRPTDQRVKLGILFQDYVPDMPNLKMYLNLLFSTGVPGGSPSYADPYDFQNRLRDYKRADLGISHIFVGGETKFPEKHWLSSFKELSVGAEVFNLFNNQNSITNTWVRDVDSKQQFAIPNFMTSRVLNLRLKMRF